MNKTREAGWHCVSGIFEQYVVGLLFFWTAPKWLDRTTSVSLGRILTEACIPLRLITYRADWKVGSRAIFYRYDRSTTWDLEGGRISNAHIGVIQIPKSVRWFHTVMQFSRTCSPLCMRRFVYEGQSMWFWIVGTRTGQWLTPVFSNRSDVWLVFLDVGVVWSLRSNGSWSSEGFEEHG